ncbi:MAG: hypothetical protein ACJAQT_000210 [Akkermansiaceae bacterium]
MTVDVVGDIPCGIESRSFGAGSARSLSDGAILIEVAEIADEL